MIIIQDSASNKNYPGAIMDDRYNPDALCMEASKIEIVIRLTEKLFANLYL